ncbi:hypothetical protein VNI00_004974 [Paramarasmius palmivorus]|uniref:F-box domain-containing protein n=1 Tax=Paramarasmius palmivorus TaxID=297713 RepID=A0AAW0DHL4_9AGAR
MPDSSHLPPELISRILRILRHDKHALGKASLISRNWTMPARSHLFPALHVSDGHDFLSLCADQHSTLVHLGTRAAALAPSRRPGAMYFLVQALLERPHNNSTVAENLFWNTEDLSITCVSPGDWTQATKLVRSGCFPKVLKLSIISSVCTKNTVVHMGDVIGAFSNLRILLMQDLVIYRASDLEAMPPFPDTLQHLILKSRLSRQRLPNPSNCCSSLRDLELTIDLSIEEHVESLGCFLDGGAASSLRRCTLQMGNSIRLSNETYNKSAVQVKKIILSKPMVDFVIEGHMRGLSSVFSHYTRNNIGSPRHLRIVLLPQASVIAAEAKSFEDMIEQDQFFHSTKEIVLQIIVSLPEDVLEAADWNEREGTVREESFPHRKGKAEFERSLDLFSILRVRSLLRCDFTYEVHQHGPERNRGGIGDRFRDDLS